MSRWLALSLLIPFALGACGKLENDSSAPSSGITLGERAQSSEHLNAAVGLVLLGDQDPQTKIWKPSMACTGTLIAKDLVLTATHCFIEAQKTIASHRPPVALVIFHDLADADDWTKYHQFIGQSFRTHPQYALMKDKFLTGVHLNDVALIKLATAVDGVTPVKLATSAPNIGDSVELAGFGQSSQAKDKSYHLQTLRSKVSPVSAQLPANATEVIISNGNLSGIDTGDSGGPELVTVNGEKQVCGVASSFGIVGGNVNYAFYESVAKNLKWLRTTAKALGSDAEL